MIQANNKGWFAAIYKYLIDLMKNSGDKNDWVTPLKETIRRNGITVYDYNDNCYGYMARDDFEFIDGRHGGK